MAPSELRVTITGAKHLKNVNWRAGALRPYAVLWLDPADKRATRVAADIDSDDGGVDAKWDDATVTIPFPPSLSTADAVLYIDLVHAASPGEQISKPLIGSAKLYIRDLLDDAVGTALPRSLKLKRPSGRTQGKIEVEVAVRDPRYNAPPPPAPASYGYSYSAPPPPQYGSGDSGYAATGYGQQYAAAGSGYGGGYGAGYGAAPAQGYNQYGSGEVQKGSKFGVGTGLAVGAAAGLVGGLALAEGVDYLEDEIADKAAEKVEDDLGYDDAGDDGGDW